MTTFYEYERREKERERQERIEKKEHELQERELQLKERELQLKEHELQEKERNFQEKERKHKERIELPERFVNGMFIKTNNPNDYVEYSILYAFFNSHFKDAKLKPTEFVNRLKDIGITKKRISIGNNKKITTYTGIKLIEQN